MRRVAEAGEAWVQGGREEADLLRGARLEAASEWAAANPERLSTDERDFVAASTAARDAARARERRTTRRLHRLVAGVSAGARRRAHRGRGRGRATQRSDGPTKPRAVTERAGRDHREAGHRGGAHAQPSDEWRSRPGHSPRRIPQQALLLALEADRLLPDDDTLGSLEVALLANPALLRSVHTAPVLNVVRLQPGGTRVSGGTSDGRIVEIDTSTGRDRAASGRPVTDPVFGASRGLRVASPFPRTASRSSCETRTAACASWRATASRARCSPGRSPLLSLRARGRSPSRPRPGCGSSTRQRIRTLRTIDGPPATARVQRRRHPAGDRDRRRDARHRRCCDSETDRATASLFLPRVHRVESRPGDSASERFNNGDARIVDVATGKTLGTPLAAGNQIHVAFSGDGSLMGAVSGSGAVWIFDSATGERGRPDQTVPFVPIRSVSASRPTTRRSLSRAASGEIAVLDLVGRQKLARPAATTGWLATFSPDGTLFAVPIDGSDNDTAIVDVATGKLLQTLHPARRFRSGRHDKARFACLQPGRSRRLRSVPPRTTASRPRSRCSPWPTGHRSAASPCPVCRS